GAVTFLCPAPHSPFTAPSFRLVSPHFLFPIPCSLFFRRLHHHSDVAGPPLVAVGTAHGRGTNSLGTWSLIDVGLRYHQLVHVHVFSFLLRIGDGRTQSLFHGLRHSLLGVGQDTQRLTRVLAANQVHHQARLLRRNSDVLLCGSCFHSLVHAPDSNPTPSWRLLAVGSPAALLLPRAAELRPRPFRSPLSYCGP